MTGGRVGTVDCEGTGSLTSETEVAPGIPLVRLDCPGPPTCVNDGCPKRIDAAARVLGMSREAAQAVLREADKVMARSADASPEGPGSPDDGDGVLTRDEVEIAVATRQWLKIADHDAAQRGVIAALRQRLRDAERLYDHAVRRGDRANARADRWRDAAEAAEERVRVLEAYIGEVLVSIAAHANRGIEQGNREAVLRQIVKIAQVQRARHALGGEDDQQ